MLQRLFPILFVLLLSSASLAQDDLFPDEPETFELKPGEKETFTYIAEVDGEASIWARSESLDVTLEVLDDAGKRVKFDDDSGGGKASHLYLPVKNEVEYSVVVAAKSAAGEVEAATVTVGLFEAQVTEAMAALVKRIEAVIAEMRQFRADGKYKEARRVGAVVINDIRNFASSSSTWLMALDKIALEHATTHSIATAAELWRSLLIARERTLPTDHPATQATRLNLSNTLLSVGDLLGAKIIQERVLAVQERTLPPDHADLQMIRHNYANTLQGLGDLGGAKALYEEVLAVVERTLPSDNPTLLAVLMNYSSLLSRLKDLPGARAIQERVLAVRERTLPDDHDDLQMARQNLALTLRALGDLARAKELEELALSVRERTLPADHPDLQAIRQNYANTLFRLGELGRAKKLQEAVLEIFEQTLSPDNLDLQGTRMNYALTLAALGDIEGAKALQEKVLAIFERMLPSDHPDLQTIRFNYAATLLSLGDLTGAKAYQKQVLVNFERTLANDHPDLQRVREQYAGTLLFLGDLAGARALQERVLSIRERTLPPDHPELQTTRQNYSVTLLLLGDAVGAKALQEEVLSVFERTRPPGHPDLMSIRQSHAITLLSLGDALGARRLQEQVLSMREATLPSDHPDLRSIHQHYATTLQVLGELVAAKAHYERVLASWDPRQEEHVGHLATRLNYARTLFSLRHEGDSDAVDELRGFLDIFIGQTIESSERTIERLSSRQVARFAVMHGDVTATSLSFASRIESSPNQAILRLSEQLRGLASRARKLLKLVGDNGSKEEEVRRLRADLAMCRRSIESFLSNPIDGGSSEDDKVTTRLADLVRAKDIAEEALGTALRRHPGAAELLRPISVEEVAGAMPPNSAAASFTFCPRWWIEESKEGERLWRTEGQVVAMILDSAGQVSRCDLGSSEVISKMIAQWRVLTEDRREALATELGREIRRLVLDPVRAVLAEDVNRLVVTLADDLHLIGLDSLPLDDGGHVGDELAIDVVNGLEWLVRKPIGELNPSGFVGIGYADFHGKPKALNELAAEVVGSRGRPVWSRDFSELPFTKAELLTLRTTYERAFAGDENAAAAKIFMGREACKQRLRLHAPKARYLHLATHGWFAPESIPSILDEREFEGLANPMITDFRDEVSGYEPLALCGLALAGANREPREDGSHPGLLNGNEIADLNLSGVELAVLSACETNVGVRRAGQGIMSLQQALFSAGVRYSITSLWKVPDEATMELMTRFYEGIWRRVETKREALWNAKLKIRNATDPRTGKPKYGLKDWAGWVLYGNPE